jgi:hypothetical protein
LIFDFFRVPAKSQWPVASSCFCYTENRSPQVWRYRLGVRT